MHVAVRTALVTATFVAGLFTSAVAVAEPLRLTPATTEDAADTPDLLGTATGSAELLATGSVETTETGSANAVRTLQTGSASGSGG